MTMTSLSRTITVAYLSASYLLSLVSAQNCTPCDIPLSLEQGQKVFGAFNCSQWEEDARWDSANTEICKLNRIAGPAFCGCSLPSYVTETCDLCPNGSIDVDLERELPDVPGVTCGDILNVPAVDGQESCSLLQAKYSFWCDCPSAEPTCTLCPSGHFPPKPNKALPFDTDLYCGDIATEFLVSTPHQCNELMTEIPVDLASYCECPGTTPPETCQLCPDGYFIDDYVIVENGLTCADIHQIARFSTNETVCEIMEDVQDTCCTKTDEAWIAPASDAEEVEVEVTPSTSGTSQLLGFASLLYVVPLLILGYSS